MDNWSKYYQSSTLIIQYKQQRVKHETVLKCEGSDLTHKQNVLKGKITKQSVSWTVIVKKNQRFAIASVFGASVLPSSGYSKKTTAYFKVLCSLFFALFS